MTFDSPEVARKQLLEIAHITSRHRRLPRFGITVLPPDVLENCVQDAMRDDSGAVIDLIGARIRRIEDNLSAEYGPLR